MQSRSIIVADCPWTYQVYSDKGKGRTAESHYGTMTNQELLDLAPLMKTAFPGDSIMCMWATPSNLPFAIQLMQEWGYTYKTIGWVWVKLNKSFNKRFQDLSKSVLNIPADDSDLIKAIDQLAFVSLGHYTRSNAELVLIGEKGKGPLQRLRKDVRQLVFAPVMEHSRKPDEVNKRIESMLRRPQDKCYEFFARRQYNDWYCTGNELDGLDIKDALMQIARRDVEEAYEQLVVLSEPVDKGDTLEQQALFVD